MRKLRPVVGDAAGLITLRAVMAHDYGTPWLKDDLTNLSNEMSLDDLIAAYDSVPAGATPCHNSSLFSPVQVPSLIGVASRKYLDHTGHVLQRDIGDLMRFSAFIQGNTIARFGGYELPPAVPGFVLKERMSDAQLYALARYLYSLTPPRNPNSPSKMSKRGAEIFAREGCGGCHTPPLYTNNSLTPALGFTPPAAHLTRYAITRVSVGTDPALALRTRKGTGYYKVPSLQGVWYRGPFEHNASVATLEDWFDPSRVRDDYIPTGFRGIGVRTRAVKGHQFGLNLPSEEKTALIAFLKTL
jgi:hypothetical protein